MTNNVDKDADLLLRIVHWAVVRNMLSLFMFVSTTTALFCWKYEAYQPGAILSAMAIASTFTNLVLTVYVYLLGRMVQR